MACPGITITSTATILEILNCCSADHHFSFGACFSFFNSFSYSIFQTTEYYVIVTTRN